MRFPVANLFINQFVVVPILYVEQRIELVKERYACRVFRVHVFEHARDTPGAIKLHLYIFRALNRIRRHVIVELTKCLFTENAVFNAVQDKVMPRHVDHF